ncbi:GAF domain-containing protein [Pseudoalteromonas sp. S16_S37]|uniref:GAF domain-containing protein n=1 Tax=Pseudoalteromonas sp. S16_S37 TaxID=2720228 RepID=UPI001680E117|nr:GAF domain-containing protein [Pseudoalteromonas sp. S16_S37]MBD1582926.1 histidine kinase [Pseudoalteromonas sp. S16_S37]
MVSLYLSRAGLTVDPQKIELALVKLEEFLDDEHNSAEAVWSYLIPELGEGGACSLFGHLQDEPFELSNFLKVNEASRITLSRLQSIVDFVKRVIHVDWFGIYQTRQTPEGKQLLKLAYCGAPSRPLFPINEQFAATSNNVQVVMSGEARVINDVQEYVACGGEYYTCDPKVQSESCLPLFDSASNCIGIIDAEAFSKDFFTPSVLALLIAVCIKIPQYLPE